MDLEHIISRQTPPIAWESGGKIPWNDPQFSARMLRNHLAQDHDWASRRQQIIDQQLACIAQLLAGGSSRILDLGCGPGFYTQGLSRLGHQCVGVDFSPASIRHAREAAEEAGLAIRYELSDVREFIPQEGAFDLVMMLFGEFNVFREDDARRILDLAFAALRDGGTLLIEISTQACVEEQGKVGPSWEAADSGLFLDTPHLCLQEHFWDERSSTATTRYTIVDAHTAKVSEYTSSAQAYDQVQFVAMLEASGFSEVFRVDDRKWPAGEVFAGKLLTYGCRRNSDGPGKTPGAGHSAGPRADPLPPE